MATDLVVVLKWLQSFIGCALYIFHLSGVNTALFVVHW